MITEYDAQLEQIFYRLVQKYGAIETIKYINDLLNYSIEIEAEAHQKKQN